MPRARERTINHERHLAPCREQHDPSMLGGQASVWAGHTVMYVQLFFSVKSVELDSGE